MEKFNNLYVSGNLKVLIKLLANIRDNLPKDWLFKEQNTKNYTENTSQSESNIICVESPLIEKQKGLVWMRMYEGKLTVINIVPTQPGSLEYSEYNAILDSFYKSCVLPRIDSKLPVSIDYQTEGINIETVAGNNTFKKMKVWEAACNKSTGNTHPMDFSRWAEFVITAHRENSELTADTFGRWLIEERGWNEEFDVTFRLILDYEYSRNLLEENDKYQ